MNKQALIQKIKEQAKQDNKKRQDPRFLETMGFLVAKGFLKTNFEIQLLPNKRLPIEDAIWAGKQVEPRILEVLPAAVLRLSKHFHLDPMVHRDLLQVVDQLRKRKEKGDDFCGIPYEKIRVWAELPLKDKRVKTVADKKITKTFRLNPLAYERLVEAATGAKCSQAEILEKLILSAGSPGKIGSGGRIWLLRSVASGSITA